MQNSLTKPVRKLAPFQSLASIAFFAALIVAPLASHARITRIVIDETSPLPAASSGGIAFEQVAGRAFGELDPKAPANALIQDIELAKDADGKVRYVATFMLTKPVDMRQASGLMWHEVPNRGVRRPNVVQDVSLATLTSPVPGRVITRATPSSGLAWA